MFTDEAEGRVYYNFALTPRTLIRMTCVKNRLYIMVISATALQWRKSKEDLRKASGV